MRGLNTIVKKVFMFLSIGGRKKLYWLVAAIVVMAVFEMFGVASILPFLSVIADPSIIEKNVQLKWVYDQFGFTNKDMFLIALGSAAFVILFFNAVFRGGVAMALMRFAWVKRYFISRQLLAKYLYGPYTFFLNRNSSELITYIQSEVARVISGVLIPFMQVFSRSLLVILIIALLFVMDPIVAVVVLGIIGGGYVAIYIFSRKRLTRTGEEYLENNMRMYKALNEAFGGIKDVKLLGKERTFIEQYGIPTKRGVHCYCSQFLIAQFPRYAFEVMAFGGILFVTIYLAVIKKDYQAIIPLIGLYSFAAYRLMPALQQIFEEAAAVRFSLPALDRIYDDYIRCGDGTIESSADVVPTMPFSRHIELERITFRYPKTEKAVIKDFDIVIKANTTIGFVGGTGAGKTTIVDILLGLLSPQEGKIMIDGVELNAKNVRMWQKNIGYVPQHIYLCDDTVTRNIAFGVGDNDINKEAVEYAARLANIHHFVVNELPQGYAAEVGERGVRLSGGQRQRIGIARALYHDPSLIVFDEATSALDGITEEAILEAIRKLAHKKTIVIVAHRLSTVKECDIIYLLEQGRMVDQGTYHELISSNEQFRRMAKIPESKNVTSDHSALR